LSRPPNTYTVLGPNAFAQDFDSLQAIVDWFYFQGPFEIDIDPDAPHSWHFADGWCIQHNP
jgi:hypothetical protein